MFLPCTPTQYAVYAIELNVFTYRVRDIELGGYMGMYGWLNIDAIIRLEKYKYRVYVDVVAFRVCEWNLLPAGCEL